MANRTAMHRGTDNKQPPLLLTPDLLSAAANVVDSAAAMPEFHVPDYDKVECEFPSNVDLKRVERALQQIVVASDKLLKPQLKKIEHRLKWLKQLNVYLNSFTVRHTPAKKQTQRNKKAKDAETAPVGTAADLSRSPARTHAK